MSESEAGWKIRCLYDRIVNWGFWASRMFFCSRMLLCYLFWIVLEGLMDKVVVFWPWSGKDLHAGSTLFCSQSATSGFVFFFVLAVCFYWFLRKWVRWMWICIWLKHNAVWNWRFLVGDSRQEMPYRPALLKHCPEYTEYINVYHIYIYIYVHMIGKDDRYDLIAGTRRQIQLRLLVLEHLFRYKSVCVCSFASLSVFLVYTCSYLSLPMPIWTVWTESDEISSRSLFCFCPGRRPRFRAVTAAWMLVAMSAALQA